MDDSNLYSVQDLKRIYKSHRLVCNLKEFRWKQRPDTWKQLVELFRNGTGDCLYHRIIWVSSTEFACLYFENFYHGPWELFSCQLIPSDRAQDKRTATIKFFSVQPDPSNQIVNLSILNLPDPDYEKMAIRMVQAEGIPTHLPLPIPLTILERLVRDRKVLSFSNVAFSKDFSHMLATRGKSTDLTFSQCCLDPSFVQAYCSRPRKYKGPLQLAFEIALPFEDNPRYLRSLLGERSLKCLTLKNIAISSDVIRELSTVSSSNLAWHNCDFNDASCARLFVSMVEKQRGPCDINFASRFHIVPVGRVEYIFRFREDFFTAIGNENTFLKRLAFNGTKFMGCCAPLFRHIALNRGLEDLSLMDFSPSSYESVILQALVKHPALLKLRFSPSTELHSKKSLTSAVVRLLTSNQIIEDIEYHEDAYDREIWDKRVVPALACNVHRKVFPSLQSVPDLDLRASLLGTALSRQMIQKHPSLTWMLIAGNLDALVNRFQAHQPSVVPMIACSNDRKRRGRELSSETSRKNHKIS